MNKPLFNEDCDAGIYSKALPHIQYVPSNKEVVTAEMTYDLTKYRELRKEIAAADIPDEVREFLIHAATRHIKFNYGLVAEYYAQCNDKVIQELMEKSGLVIIDFDDAIENGFVEMTDTLKSLYYEKKGEEKKDA